MVTVRSSITNEHVVSRISDTDAGYSIVTDIVVVTRNSHYDTINARGSIVADSVVTRIR